jgi:NADH-quinone oxidoreductase subunit J
MLSIFFYLFAGVAIFSAFCVTKARNPVNSALWLVTTFICFAVLYVTLDAPFMAAIQIMVYAGAIMVLIIFVIMLLNLGTAEKKCYTHALAWGGGVSALLLFITSYFVQASKVSGTVGEITKQTIKNYGHTELIGKAMFTDFLLPFEIASVLLLVAIIGAVVLSKREV